MSTPRIGYLLKAFPVVSETFIANEVRAMESHDVRVTILALKAAPPGPVHGVVGEIASPRRQAPSTGFGSWLRLLPSHGWLALHRSPSYWRALRREVGRALWSLVRRPSHRRLVLLRKRLRRFGWAGWVARRTRIESIEHLHAHYATEPLRVAHLVKKLVGTSYSFTAHAKDLYQAPEARLRRRLASARFATSCHKDGVARLRRLAPENKRGRVLFVRHGIDLKHFARRPRDRGQVLPRRILAVGRLTEKKGFEDLVEACDLLARQGENFVCDIVGDGKLRTALVDQIHRLGLEDRVRLHGFVRQDDLPNWHARACFLVAPCKELADGNRDGVPNVVLEAMAAGVPLVASTAAGLPEVLEDETTALLTPPGDPIALAGAMSRLLANSQLGADLSRAASRRVENLDFQSTNRRLAREFHRILAARVESAIERATAAAWSGRGLARKATKRLGLRPQLHTSIEKAIAQAVLPGLRANAWRPDLERLAGRRLWDEAVKGARLRKLVPLLLGHEPRRSGRILDLGSGRGGLSVALRARGFEVTALDLRFRNCLVAQLRGHRYDLELSAVNSVGEHLPFADASFDSIACLEVLEHVGDPLALLREIRRVLAPDGRCAVTVINRWAHLDPHYHLWGLNFLPRRLANHYIDWRRRTKVSYRDRQTLDEMHYYAFRDFVRLAQQLGFDVDDPNQPHGLWRRALHRLSRWTSLGFNSTTLVLRRPGMASEQPINETYRDQRDLTLATVATTADRPAS